ncbi:MAG TPA: PQQ-binding-like beta-propeller repeat protein [Anaerolineales bacterium]|nr:PQQ-binding-like beta-propeller repeat protein [Anaerolineales bacterium]
MKLKHLIISIALLILASALTACAGGATAATSWPGLLVAGDIAYVAYNTQVHAVQISNGSEQWRFPAEADNKITFYAKPALAPDDQLVVGGYNNVLYSLNPGNGSVHWSFTGAKNRFIAAPLAAQGGVFAPDADKKVYGLDLNGSEIWTYEMKGESWAQPIADSQCKCLYVASMDHTVYALDPANGNLLWRSADLGGAMVGTPALDETTGTLYVGTFDKQMLAISTQDGSVPWRFATAGWVWSSPALDNGRLYFGDLDGNFYAVDAAEGTKVWQLTPDQLDGAIAGTPLVVDNVIYFTTESGSLFAVDTTGKKMWSQAIGGKLYTAPAEAGDLILVTPIDNPDLLVAVSKDGGAKKWSFNPNPQQ